MTPRLRRDFLAGLWHYLGCRDDLLCFGGQVSLLPRLEAERRNP